MPGPDSFQARPPTAPITPAAQATEEDFRAIWRLVHCSTSSVM